MERISVRMARRLALARAGLLKPEWTAMPARVTERARRGKRARRLAEAVVARFGYLQLDTVAIAGARSHALVLLARIEGLAPEVGEELLAPGGGLFEYWGHEASWLPLELYPAFEFRRRELRAHPWWGDLVRRHPKVAKGLVERIRAEGPLRSVDLEGERRRGGGWWDLKVARKVASALWSSGELAIRERRAFQISYDLAERVIPAELRERPLGAEEALEVLVTKALDGHGWATSGTIARTWRLARRGKELAAALARLVEQSELVPCVLHEPGERDVPGWIRSADLELAARLERVRPRAERGVLLSPFDPVLWDRARVARLFGFDQVLEIFKPAAQRTYGYYCLPVLAGERLVARYDLKAERKSGRLRVLSLRFEGTGTRRAPTPTDRAAAENALARHAEALQLAPAG